MQPAQSELLTKATKENIGQTVKPSWFCKVMQMDANYARGGWKAALLKEVGRFIDYKECKEGKNTKYYLACVKELPDPYTENRGKNHSIYKENVMLSLCYYLSKYISPNCYEDFRENDLLYAAGIVKEAYRPFGGNYSSFADAAFYYNSYSTLHGILERALVGLQSKGIKNRLVYKVKDKAGVCRDAKPKEITDYSEQEQIVLSEMNCADRRMVRFSHQSTEFKKKLQKKLESKGLLQIYSVIRIYYNDKLVEMAISKLDAQRAISQFNGKLADNLQSGKALNAPYWYSYKETIKNGKLESVKKQYIPSFEDKTLCIQKYIRICGQSDMPLPERFADGTKVEAVNGNKDGTFTYELIDAKGKKSYLSLNSHQYELYECCLPLTGKEQYMPYIDPELAEKRSKEREIKKLGDLIDNFSAIGELKPLEEYIRRSKCTGTVSYPSGEMRYFLYDTQLQKDFYITLLPSEYCRIMHFRDVG